MQAQDRSFYVLPQVLPAGTKTLLTGPLRWSGGTGRYFSGVTLSPSTGTYGHPASPSTGLPLTTPPSLCHPRRASQTAPGPRGGQEARSATSWAQARLVDSPSEHHAYSPCGSRIITTEAPGMPLEPGQMLSHYRLIETGEGDEKGA